MSRVRINRRSSRNAQRRDSSVGAVVCKVRRCWLCARMLPRIAYSRECVQSSRRRRRYAKPAAEVPASEHAKRQKARLRRQVAQTPNSQIPRPRDPCVGCMPPRLLSAKRPDAGAQFAASPSGVRRSGPCRAQPRSLWDHLCSEGGWPKAVVGWHCRVNLDS